MKSKDQLKQEAKSNPDGNLGLNIRMDGETLSVAQKEKKSKKGDDPNGDLGLTINLGG
jgi:hypothetical protein